jgi:hypothetical protein
MKHKSIFILLVVITISTQNSFSQNIRRSDYNSIGWWNHFATIKLNKTWGIHAEYQWRRENIVTDWQQSLARTGVNYRLNPKTLLRAGYAWILTYPYGDVPLQSAGKTFNEHRTFQMALVNDKIGRMDLSHRFMLEQRWVGRFNSSNSKSEEEFLFMNRMRYMVRAQFPLQGPTLENNEWYVEAYDELFIGFGKNVNQNIFDQNRIGVLLGYRINPMFRVEGGYFNQILQLGRFVNGQEVFQYNSGVILNTYLNLDLSKKNPKSN